MCFSFFILLFYIPASRTGRYLKEAGLLIHVKPYYSVIEEQTVTLYK